MEPIADVRPELAGCCPAAGSAQQVELSTELAGFAAGLAHDFNNVLAVVGNYAALLSRRESDAMTRADLAEILAAVQRGRSITGQLQAIAGRELIEPVPVELNALLDSFLATRAEMLEHLLGDRLELQVVHSEVPVVAYCDRRQLDQILLSLVNNAAAMMPAGGTIGIAVQSAASPEGRSEGQANEANQASQAKLASIRVVDTGGGLTDHDLSRIFEPFFSTGSRRPGSGLSLAAVHGMVRQNRGQIRVASTAGQGTCVQVLLPSADPAPQPAPPSDSGGAR